LRPQTAAVEPGQIGCGAVGGVGPHIAGGVVAIEHRAKLAAIISPVFTLQAKLPTCCYHTKRHGYVLPGNQLKQREAAFLIDRDQASGGRSPGSSRN
jgi:hypothetical protein